MPSRLLMGLLCAALLTNTARAAAPEVTLLTVGPGDSIFTCFGHAALMVRDANAMPRVFNYGYTDFGDGELVWSFLRGQSRFWVDTTSLGATLRGYRREDRTLYRQRLNLTPEQAWQAASLLDRGSLPQNRYYTYHHFNDNCSTRLRDLMDRVTVGAIARQTRGQVGPDVSLRMLARRGFAPWLPLLLGVDLLLGRTLDRRLDRWDGTFLPRMLRQTVMQVQLPGGQPLAGRPEVVYRRRAPEPGGDPMAGAKLLWLVTAGAALLGVILIGLARRGARWIGLPLALLALPLGLLGLLVWAVVAVASLPELRHNELVLVLWPLDLGLIWPAVRWLRGRPWAGRLLRGYLWLRLGVLALVLVGHLTTLLIQRPLVWIALALTLTLSTHLAVRHLPRRRDPDGDATQAGTNLAGTDLAYF